MWKLSTILILLCGDFYFLIYSLPQFLNPSFNIPDPVVGLLPPSKTEVTNEELGPHDAEILSTYSGYVWFHYLHTKDFLKWIQVYFFICRYKVYRLQANTTKAYEALKKLHEEGDLDFWQAPSFRGDTDILVNENQEKELMDFMGFYKIDNSVMINDIDT